MKGFLVCFLLLSGLLQAQQAQKLPLELAYFLKTATEDQPIPLVLRGNEAGIRSFVRTEGGQFSQITEGIMLCYLLPASVRRLNQCAGLDFVEFSASRPQLLTDVMLLNNNVHPVHQGAAPLPQAYTGADVIMGYVDSGIELNHPDFQNSDGSTRVLAIWDQTQDEIIPFRVPEPYGYGQEWNAEDINAGITGHDDQAQFFGHGSTVAGVGSGNGFASGQFKGVAPDADIIAVSSDFSRENWKISVAEAVNFIFTKAEAIGKPAVVNLSLGDYYGSHDGLDAAAIWIDEMLEESNGRVVVAAAGNSGNVGNYHLSYDVTASDTAFTWFKYNPQALESGAVFFEVWADAADFENVHYAVGVDAVTPTFQFRGYSDWQTTADNLDVLVTDTIFFNGQQMGIVETWAALRGDQVLLQVAVTQPFATNYRWRFSTTGSGKFDCWSYAPFGTSEIFATGLPTTAAYPPMADYRLPDNEKTIVDSWVCSDKVIAVGNYYNRESFVNYLGELTTYPVTQGAISLNSSRGPTRDDRQKPTIAASGDNTLSAGRLVHLNALINNEPHKVAQDGWHYINGGTSMSSPVVAGAAALYLQRDPEASYQDVRDAVIDNALADMFTGVLPGLQFGNGKLDVFGMLTNPFQVTGFREGAIRPTFELYPNPAGDRVTLRFADSPPTFLLLADLTGRQLASWSGPMIAADLVQLDLPSVSNGCYILSGKLESGILVQKKFIVSK